MILVWFLVIICLGYAAYKDFKTYEVPVGMFVITTIVVTAVKLITNAFDWRDSVLGIAMCFGVYFILAMFFDGGGGDIVMMSMLGWCLGIRNSAYIILFSSFIYFIALIACNNKKKKLPYAPGVFTGTLLTSIIGIMNI